uniref:Uncharacterized protein n=1 Tax=Amphilophus citrinellus TaxID=61819 RepID=A0A3Q0SDQ3_AMPCI
RRTNQLRLTFWMVPLRLRIIISTLSNRTVGSMGGISAGLRVSLELILIFCSRFFVMKLVRSPSWLTVPSSSKAEEMVALRPSDWPLLPPPRAPEPPGTNISNLWLQNTENSQQHW